MQVLFISGSIGLGHVTRDLAIAKAIRAQCQEAEIVWLAGEPARSMLREAGERLHPLVERLQSETDIADDVATAGRMNVFRYASKASRLWTENVKFFNQILQRERIDVLVGDETYDISTALRQKKLVTQAPFVMIFDFIGLDATSFSLLERLGVYYFNWLWSRDGALYDGGKDRALFIGEPEDIPDRPLGLGLPNRRAHAKRYYRFVGYVLPFDLAEVADRQALRAELGYDDAPRVVVAVGGTATGRDILEACARAFPLAAASIPNLQMTLVCGPRIAPQSVAAPQGVRIEGFVPRLYQHFAVCDMAIVQAGGATTLELTALRRPFVYLPLEGHSEQEIDVCGRLERHRAGLRLTRREMTPHRLAELIVANIGKEADWGLIPTNGAAVAASLVLEAAETAHAAAA